MVAERAITDDQRPRARFGAGEVELDGLVDARHLRREKRLLQPLEGPWNRRRHVSHAALLSLSRMTYGVVRRRSSPDSRWLRMCPATSPGAGSPVHNHSIWDAREASGGEDGI